MIVEILALITSISSALGSIFIAKGMKCSSPVIAAFYSILTQTIILTVVIIAKTVSLNITAILLFAIGGLLSLGIGRLLYFISMNKIGVARSSAIVGSSPVFTVILSILILAEQPTIIIVLGAIAVSVGIVLASGVKEFKFEKTVIIALIATFSYALSNIVSKLGLKIEQDPYLSAQIGAMSSLIFFLMYIIFSKQKNGFKISKTGLLYFMATGIVMSIGWLAMMAALGLGSVSVVTTIVYSYPLFTLLLSRIFLKEEKFGEREVFGSILIILGVVMVTLL
ncbi:MAG: DMT family transporter [Nitrososphaeria archaeon]